jgi:hypothetical protein
LSCVSKEGIEEALEQKQSGGVSIFEEKWVLRGYSESNWMVFGGYLDGIRRVFGVEVEVGFVEGYVEG